MRIMPLVVGMISPFTTMFVPEMLCAATPFTSATGWTRRQLSRNRRVNTLGRHT